jgi:type I restriction enzyme S subunit
MKFDDLKRMPLIVPPNENQIEIVKTLDTIINKFEALIEKSQSMIKLLEERRSVLISDLVTGQIDVRDFKEVA